MSSTGPRGSGRWWKAEVGYRLARLHGSYTREGWECFGGCWMADGNPNAVLWGLSCQHIPRWGDVGRSKQGTCRMSQTTRSPHSSSNNFWVSRDIFWWHCPTQHWFLVRPVYRGLLLIFRGCLTLTTCLPIDTKCRLGDSHFHRTRKLFMDKSQKVELFMDKSQKVAGFACSLGVQSGWGLIRPQNPGAVLTS